MPVYLHLREELIVNINATDDNSFSFDYFSEGNSGFDAVFLGGAGWKMNNSAEWYTESAENFNWDINASYNAIRRDLQLKPRISLILMQLLTGPNGIFLSRTNQGRSWSLIILSLPVSQMLR